MRKTSRGHDRILKTAVDLFAKNGYDGVSIADIARAARVSKATVFHHFPRKVDLYRTILAGAAADFRAQIEPALTMQDGLLQGLARFGATQYQALVHRESASRLVMREIAEGSRRFRDLVREGKFGGGLALVVSLLKEAQSAGHIRPEIDCRIAALTLFAATMIPFQFRGALDDAFRAEYLEEPERFAAAVADLLVRGMTPAR